MAKKIKNKKNLNLINKKQDLSVNSSNPTYNLNNSNYNNSVTSYNHAKPERNISLIRERSEVWTKNLVIKVPKFDHLSPAERLEIENIKLQSDRNYKLISVPLLAILLYTINQVVIGQILNLAVNLFTDLEYLDFKKSISFLTFRIIGKKLIFYIGKIVLTLFFIVFINYALRSIPISYIDCFFYIKIYLCFGCVASLYLALDYFIQYLLLDLFRENNINIPKKLPVWLYKYLDYIKRVSQLKGYGSGFFVKNFFLFLVMSICHILLLLLL